MVWFYLRQRKCSPNRCHSLHFVKCKSHQSRKEVLHQRSIGLLDEGQKESKRNVAPPLSRHCCIGVKRLTAFNDFRQLIALSRMLYVSFHQTSFSCRFKKTCVHQFSSHQKCVSSSGARISATSRDLCILSSKNHVVIAFGLTLNSHF